MPFSTLHYRIYYYIVVDWYTIPLLVAIEAKRNNDINPEKLLTMKQNLNSLRQGSSYKTERRRNSSNLKQGFHY